MKEPYCGNCGKNLLDWGVVEVCTAPTYAEVSFRETDFDTIQKEYGDIETDFNNEVFEHVDCSNCGHSLNEDQTREYLSMGVW